MSERKRLIPRVNRDSSRKRGEPRSVEYDVSRRVFLRAGRLVANLAPQEAVVLDLLLERPESVVSLEAIERRLWPHARPGHSAGRVRDLVQKLRHHFGDIATHPFFIETITHSGYAFIGALEEIQAAGLALTTSAVPPVAERVVAEKKSAGDPDVPKAAGKRNKEIVIFSLIFVALLSVFVWADAFAIYGIACLTLGMSVVFAILIHWGLRDSVMTRLALSLHLLAAMAYIPSAVTFTDMLQDVVNMTTLPPSFIYPFVTGMKFLPLFVPPLALWCIFPASDRMQIFKWAHLPWTYALVGALFFVLTCFALITNSNDQRIWAANVPESRSIFAAYCVIGAINFGVWFMGRCALGREPLLASRSLPLFLLACYAPVALLGAFVDQSYNDINRYDLDKRRPSAFLITNPSAKDQIEQLLREPQKYGIGPDLATLLADDVFVRSLPARVFYRRNFDEPFQLQSSAVIFAFRPGAEDPSRRIAFLSIRFPRRVVELLRFQPAR